MKLIASYSTAIVATALLISGCLPTEDKLARYDTTTYTADISNNEFAGTWIFTFNNESSEPLTALSPYYTRDLVRIRPMPETPGSFEVTYCNTDPAILQTTATASGNTLTLPIGGEIAGQPTYVMTNNGHLSATVTDGGLSLTWRAVRISSDPDLDIGTVNVGFTSGATAVTAPAVCFSELQYEADVPGDFLLAAIGRSDTDYASAMMWKQPTDTFIFGSDEPPFWFGHQFEGAAVMDTVQPTSTGVKGTARTLGFSPDSGGVIRLNITL